MSVWGSGGVHHSGMGRRKWFSIEQKSFEVEIDRSNREEFQASFLERGKGRVFQASTTVGGARWMGRYLCEASVKSLDPLRYQDPKVSVVGCIKNNDRGLYVEFVCRIKNNKALGKPLCFPTGLERDGWAVAGLSVLDLLGQETKEGEETRNPGVKILERKKEVPAPSQNLQPGVSKNNDWPDFGVKNRQQTRLKAEIPRVVVESKGGVLDCSWWKNAVICTPSSRIDSWRTTLNQISQVFGEADLTSMSSGEAIVFLREAIEKLKSRSLMIHLLGIPIHLKKKPLVEKLMKLICPSFEIIEKSLALSSSNVKVRVLNPEWENIPRLAVMEERGYIHNIIIDVESEESMVLNIPTDREEHESTHSGQEDNWSIPDTAGEVRSNGDGSMGKLNTWQQRAHDKIAFLSKSRQVEKDEWLTWRPLRKQKNQFSPIQEVGPSDEILPSYVDVMRKGKTVMGNEAVGQRSFFEPIADISTEEGLNSYISESSCLKPVTMTHKLWKPKKKMNWGVGPSLVMSKSKWAGPNNKKQREKHARLVREVLQSMDLKNKNISSCISQAPISVPAISPGNAPSSDPISLLAPATCVSGGPQSVVPETPEVNSEVSIPPGFEGRRQGKDQLGSSGASHTFVTSEGLSIHNADELKEWIVNLVKPAAVQLGLSSNQGEKFIDKAFLDVGCRNLGDQNLDTVNEDERERSNYKNANAILGEAFVDHDV
ncbi:hypothetical protein FRX31_023139 [Thalictrum thalictroides]|uniref:Uncharacterized protein n=1 Tax=Thalictrum thalictroides TaxID=46969 RepID=A0A7J6VQX8_THATH|nr:hypothetical protein FRX31_023139 [Thalictrum thalictroides]